MAEVSTAQELGAYQAGNAGLAGGAASNEIGYAPVNIDYSPLQTYALAKYKTNLINYETKEKDRAKVEEMFKDPNINVPLDEHLAEQVRPKLEEFKNEMAKNPSAYSDPKAWYRIQQLDRELLADNAKLKTVQVAKDHYNQLAGAEPDEFKKKNYQDYVAKLEKYKLGEEVPVYNDHFVFDEKHLPDLQTAKSTSQRINGDKIETVEKTMYNGIDALDKARQQHITDGSVNNTGQDLASTLLTHGGLPELNKKIQDAYDQQLKLNFGLLKDKYAGEFKKYQSANPDATFSDFIKATNRQGEVVKIGEKLDFLKPLSYINDNGQDNPDLNHSYAYDKNGVRLNADNDTLRAIYSVLRNPIGAEEKVLKSEISTKPAEIDKLKADTANNRMKALAYVKGVNDKGALIHAKIAKMKSNDEKEAYMSQLWDRNPIIQKGNIAMIQNGNIFSGIPADKSLPIYTIGDKGNVEILKPIGATPIYDATDKDGKKTEKSKIVGWKGGNYKLEYVDPSTNQPMEDAILADYNSGKADHPGVTLDQFIKAGLKMKRFDYIIRGENGTTDRKLNASAQLKISNPATGKEDQPVFDTENLTPTNE